MANSFIYIILQGVLMTIYLPLYSIIDILKNSTFSEVFIDAFSLPFMLNCNLVEA